MIICMNGVHLYTIKIKEIWIYSGFVTFVPWSIAMLKHSSLCSTGTGFKTDKGRSSWIKKQTGTFVFLLESAKIWWHDVSLIMEEAMPCFAIV